MSTKIAGDKSPITRALPMACTDEGQAVAFLEAMRWGDKPRCFWCESEAVYKIADSNGGRNKRFLWRCKECDRQYTVRVGTVMEDSRIPLQYWCYAFWKACSSKKGVSALQIKRETGLSYKSALFMMHRVRHAMTDSPPPGTKLSGTVEADETYVGGKPRFDRESRPRRFMGLPTTKPKAPVMVMVERGGRARALTLERVTARKLSEALKANVHHKARLITDDHKGYVNVGKRHFRQHDTIRHSHQIYSDGDVNTNTVESFNALLKRGLIGTFHSVSRQHLHRYVSEFEFRWNTRGLEDGHRAAKAIKQAEGKRLKYRDPKPIRR